MLKHANTTAVSAVDEGNRIMKLAVHAWMSMINLNLVGRYDDADRARQIGNMLAEESRMVRAEA